MPKQRYDPANFDALDDEQKLWLIRYDLEEEWHGHTTKADLYMFLNYLFCMATGEEA